MNPDRFQLVMAVFEEVAPLGPAERRRILDDRLANDAAARAEVDSLLSHHDRHRSPVQTAAGLEAVGGTGTWLDGERAAAPVLKGDYRILRTIGEGGMGVVFEAEQAFPRRRVALKAVRPGLASRGMLRRFRNEVQLLARLQHPGIAQIYEAGLAEENAADQAFFAMELIDGRPITQYAAANQLDARARWELLHRVCDAVQHAHQRGVIHRDLKPANILVTGGGQPKIVDFGVARAAEGSAGPGDEASQATRAGQLIGTPSYMSPEQMRGEIVDTRSDIYALGVIAYELLAGRLPFDLGSHAITEAARIVAEDDPPTLSSISREFRGDAEIIVAKAMAKEAARRYSSAADMAEDIRRLLAGEPIAARRDSAAYLLRKQLRRYRTAAAMAAVAVLALAVISVYTLITAQEQHRLAVAAQAASAEATRAKEAALSAKAEADGSRAAAEEAARRARDELAQANIERGRLEGLAGNLPFAEDILWRAHLAEPQAPAPYWALWELYNRHPTTWTVQGPRRTARAVGSRDGRSLVVSIATGEIALVETADGRESLRLRIGAEQPASVAISPDSQFIAVGLGRGGIAIISARDQAEIFRLDHDGAAGVARAVEWLEDGRLLAAGHADKTVRIWDTLTGDVVSAFPTGALAPSCIAASADGRLLAIGTDASPTADIRIMTADTGRMLVDLQGVMSAQVHALGFSIDGATLFAGSRDGIAMAVDVAGGRATTIPVSNMGPVLAACASPDGRRVLFSSGERMSIVDTATLTVSRTFPRQRFVVLGAGWIDDRDIVCITSDGLVRRMGASDDPSATRLSHYPNWCFSVAYSPDGRRMAVGPTTGEIEIYSTADHRRTAVHSLGGQRLRIRKLRFLPDSDTLLAAAQDGLVRIIDARDGSLIATLESSKTEIYGLDVDPAGRLAAVGHADGITRLWDLTSRDRIAEIPRQEKRVEGVAFSPDGRTLLLANLNTGLQVFDVPTRAATGRISTVASPWGVAFSPDGSLVYTSTHGGTLEVFDAATLTRRAMSTGHQRLAPGLAVSPDGRLIASGGEDGIIKVFESASLRSVLTLDPSASVVVDLAFSPDSARLAAATAGRLTIVYDFRAGDRFIRGNIDYQRQRIGPLPAPPASLAP